MPPSNALPYAESSWERSTVSPVVDEHLLEAVFVRWSDLRGMPWDVLAGGLRTLNLRFGDRVVRIAIVPDHDLRKEAAVMDCVRGEVRVPRLLGGDAGALLLEYVPHVPIPGTAAAARAVGRAAARIHAHRFERSGFLDGDLGVVEPFTTALDGLLEWVVPKLRGTAGRRLGDRARAVEALWGRYDAELRAACAQPALTHADFKPANVKWVPAESDVVVFDWEFAWAGPPLMDIGQFLRWGVPGPFAAGLARAYQEAGGVLPGGWRRTCEVLDLFSLVAFLDDREDRPIRDRDVLLRISETLARSGNR